MARLSRERLSTGLPGLRLKSSVSDCGPHCLSALRLGVNESTTPRLCSSSQAERSCSNLKFPIYKRRSERDMTLDTAEGCHLPPRGDFTPRLFRASAIARSVVSPSDRMACRTGARCAAKESAFWIKVARP
jgi:hypothetical protein